MLAEEDRKRLNFNARVYVQRHKNEKIYQLRRRWTQMKTRCLNKNYSQYYLHGGRGIKICERWLKFNNFKKDMEKNYRKDLSLDRINNDGNYEPSNCRWSTKEEQANNKRNNRIIKFNGSMKSVAQWAKFLGLTNSALDRRINFYKWSIKKCLETPLRRWS